MLNVLGNLNHSNIHMPMPGFVHNVFATPDIHRLHHEINATLGRSNLSPGTMLPDHLFGTFRHPRTSPAARRRHRSKPDSGQPHCPDRLPLDLAAIGLAATREATAMKRCLPEGVDSRAILYVPLAAHVIPTLLIGFAVVLPGSPIEGVNVYTLGFLSAVLGSVPAYVAGVAIAQRQERKRR
ncbi:MAG: hypothetical protein HC778_03825 [Chamaesiphon sp. CSU_1_12]|nr:hypothetical protein [Chamaesiphon sp. CSU_1_12]